MQTPTLAEPEAAAAVEEAAVEAAVEEAAVEAEEPPQAVRTPVAPTTAEAFRKSRREIIFIILFSFINAYHSISQSALVTRFAVSVCIITIRPTVRNRTNRQDYLPYFVSVPQYILLYPKIFLLSSTILHICATSVQIYCVCAYHDPLQKDYCFSPSFHTLSRYLVIIGATPCPNLPSKI